MGGIHMCMSALSTMSPRLWEATLHLGLAAPSDPGHHWGKCAGLRGSSSQVTRPGSRLAGIVGPLVRQGCCLRVGLSDQPLPLLHTQPLPAYSYPGVVVSRGWGGWQAWGLTCVLQVSTLADLQPYLSQFVQQLQDAGSLHDAVLVEQVGGQCPQDHLCVRVCVHMCARMCAYTHNHGH